LPGLREFDPVIYGTPITLPISPIVLSLKGFSTLVTQKNETLHHQDGCQNNYQLLSKYALTGPLTWSFGIFWYRRSFVLSFGIAGYL